MGIPEYPYLLSIGLISLSVLFLLSILSSFIYFKTTPKHPEELPLFLDSPEIPPKPDPLSPETIQKITISFKRLKKLKN